MLLLNVNWNPTGRELRVFGAAAIIAGAVLGLVLHRVQGLAMPWTLAIVCLGLAVGMASLLSRRLGRVLFVGLTLAAMPIGLAVSFVVMALFYFLLLTPLALVFRLLGRDALDRHFTRDSGSCWRPHEQTTQVKRYFQQF